MSKSPSIETLKPNQPLPELVGYMHTDAINYNVRHLAGRVLTIIDASTADQQQRKAAKDLVKLEFKRTLSDIWSAAHSVNRGDAQSSVSPLQEID